MEPPLLRNAFNVGWTEWAEQIGVDCKWVNSQCIKYVDSAVLLEAAINGQGVVLARHLLAARYLELGRLAHLDDSFLPLDRGLFFVCRPGDQERASVRVFKTWLMSVKLEMPPVRPRYCKTSMPSIRPRSEWPVRRAAALQQHYVANSGNGLSLIVEISELS
ncbi:MAG: LysR substrate-binding domain-containing protein [Pseudomonadota bacterium]